MIPEGRKPIAWADLKHPSTWEQEARDSRVKIAELEAEIEKLKREKNER